MPAAVPVLMGLVDLRDKCCVHETTKFCSAGSNTGAVGRHAFVTKRGDPRKESPFAIRPENPESCKKSAQVGRLSTAASQG
mmetsp:Transcript_5017/g.15046  ORF Transcript_5017/g.15046 Transcript_5017/m.15046 type:complete len:81 (-) Transcript_5017:257-499(-)